MLRVKSFQKIISCNAPFQVKSFRRRSPCEDQAGDEKFDGVASARFLMCYRDACRRLAYSATRFLYRRVSRVTYARWRNKFHLVSPTGTEFFLRTCTRAFSHLDFFSCISLYRSYALMPLRPVVLTSILRKLSLSDVETPAK